MDRNTVRGLQLGEGRVTVNDRTRIAVIADRAPQCQRSDRDAASS
jgi:hypothetical protein